MKYISNTSLKHLAVALLCTLILVFGFEYLIIRSKIKALEDVEQKKDFVRGAQVKSQELALQIQRFIHGEKDLAPIITSNIDHYEHLTSLLAKGGRIDGADLFIKPLSRLPKITFDNLYENWVKYKESALIVLTEPEDVIVENSIQQTKQDSLVNDSTLQAVAVPTRSKQLNKAVQKAKTLLAGQWLTLSNWHDKLITDLHEEEEKRDEALNNWFLFLIFIDLGLMGGVYYLFRNFMLKPLQQLEANTLSKTYSLALPQNEIGSLAGQINKNLEQLKVATDFVEKISEGNLEIDYRELDIHYTTGQNKLADSLVSMQAKLKTLNEEEQKRQWSNEGLAKFVDILRSSNDNIHDLGDNIIAALVHYTHSNQGGLYVLNDEDENNKYLELISLFAFESKKFEKRKLKLGEGILGQTFLEKETTYLNEIPEDYIKITSGLGDASPRTILMVPLKVDTEMYGMVELASFKEYKPHEIAFVEKLGETIASTLASVKSAQRNRHLIEQFQQQTEEMRAQEEEMRQNMEELQATQEEMARKERTYISRLTQFETDAAKAHSEQDFINLREEMLLKEKDYQVKIKDFETKLGQKPTHGDDWALAQEVEKALKINLEALKITQTELDRKVEKG